MSVYFQQSIVMSYNATVYNIMIASPGDVKGEKQIVRDTIYEWNAINSEHQNVVLLPIAWETHSIPVTGDRPQALINKQVLSHSDLLIAIFWKRIGTPTGVAQGGTVEEIEEHIKAGKPALIYFSLADSKRDDFDNNQYQAVKEFRELKKQKGLIEIYDDQNDFRRKFARQLALTINSHDYFKPNKTQEKVDDPTTLIASMRKELKEMIQAVEKKTNEPPRWG